MSAAIESLARLRDAVGKNRSADLPAEALVGRLDTLHRDGLAAFDALGIPTRQQERWKGTNLAPLEAMTFTRIGASESGVELDAAINAFSDADLVFVDGLLTQASAQRADLPEGIRVLSLQEAATEAPQIPENYLGALAETKIDALTGLQSALFEDAAIVHLAANTQASRPIRILSLATASKAPAEGASASFPRLLVVAEKGAEGTVVFENRCEGEVPGLTSLVAEFFLADNARIETIELQAEGAERVHLTQTFAQVRAGASFDSHVISLGDGLLRSELSVNLQEPGAETRLHGFFLGRGDAHLDHFTTVDHAAPHCTSDEEYRGVLADSSKGVFRGLVIIRPDAQKSDARQYNPNLLLSDRAAIDTKPQLEIYADDVKASHGSTIGQLDADALFFLRARGIDEADAKLLLTRAFAQSVVNGIKDEGARALVAEQVDAALETLQGTSLPPESGGAQG